MVAGDGVEEPQVEEPQVADILERGMAGCETPCSDEAENAAAMLEQGVEFASRYVHVLAQHLNQVRVRERQDWYR